jgi:dCTP deaminase
MAFWSGEKLLTSQQVVDPFFDAQIDCNAYNLRMGESYYCTADQEGSKEQKKTLLSDRECFLIPPGQFAFLLSKEIIKVPHDAMAFISMRTPVKLQGLINVSGFHVDPGYRGRLIFAVYNASPSPVQICENEHIFKIWFCDLDRPSQAPFVFAKPGYYDISSDLIKGMTKEVLSLQSLADKLRNQEAEFNTRIAEQRPVIENLTHIWRTVILAVIAAVILGMYTLAMTFSIPSVFALGQAFGAYWSGKTVILHQGVPISSPTPDK